MADIRNDREREELHKAIWSIADDLRGSVDGWDFKQYVLGVMFYRYISENLTNYINEGEHAAGDAQFDYAKMKDSDAEGARAGLVQEKGFFILPSELFCNVLARADKDDNLNEQEQQMTKTSTKRWSGFSTTSRIPPKEARAKTILPVCSMIWT